MSQNSQRSEKINQIVESIVHSTENGSLKWTSKNSIFNNDTSHRYIAVSPDGITTFEVTIELNTELEVSGSQILTINNPNMINKNLMLTDYSYPDIVKISNYIHRNILQRSNKVDQDEVMNDILSGVGKDIMRDKKITSILDKKSNLPKKEIVNILVNSILEKKDKETPKKKSFIKRLLGR